MISTKLLEAAGLERTYDTKKNELEFLEALRDPEILTKVISSSKETTYPFYRLFSNYGTGIGETIEEVVGKKFTDIIPKKIVSERKNKQTIKKNKIYEEYNKENGKKPSNYDWLFLLMKDLKTLEVKVIRAASGKESQEEKFYEIPSLLEERALSFSEANRSGNGTFQQTKAGLFNFLLGIVIYTDQIDYYLVSSDDIKSGKLKITNQHAGAINEDGSTNEGHLSFRDLESYKILSVFSEEELLTKDTLSKYIK